MSGPGVAFEAAIRMECIFGKTIFLLKIIDPETGEVLEDGQEGELVLTSLRREAMPLIRYRTRTSRRSSPVFANAAERTAGFHASWEGPTTCLW